MALRRCSEQINFSSLLLTLNFYNMLVLFYQILMLHFTIREQPFQLSQDKSPENMPVFVFKCNFSIKIIPKTRKFGEKIELFCTLTIQVVIFPWFLYYFGRKFLCNFAIKYVEDFVVGNVRNGWTFSNFHFNILINPLLVDYPLSHKKYLLNFILQIINVHSPFQISMSCNVKLVFGSLPNVHVFLLKWNGLFCQWILYWNCWHCNNVGMYIYNICVCAR